MKDFLEEIQATIDAGIYSPALFSAIMIPDAAGAIEYPRMRNGERYRTWYDTFVGSYQNQWFTFDGSALWTIRNGMLHETSISLKKYGYDRVLFTVPNRAGNVMHMNITSGNGGNPETALNLDLARFCADLIAGANKWMTQISGDAVKAEALNSLVQFRANGLAPHIVGIPMVC